MTTMISTFRTVSLSQQQRCHAIIRATTYRSSYQRSTHHSSTTGAVCTSSGVSTTGLLQRIVIGCRPPLIQTTIPSSYTTTITTTPINFHHRTLTTLMPEDEIKQRIEEFQELFVEARYCIEDANDAADSTYFDEEAQSAKEAVDKAVTAFDCLIEDIKDVDQKNGILRSNGLKVEQLKGELQMALNGGH